MEISFFMAMERIPTATGQERGYNRKTDTYYEHAGAKQARAKLNGHLAKYRPETPLTGPLRLTVKWCFPETKTHPAGTWKTTRPDTDNLQKILKDEMTRLGFWKDDAQVCSEIIEKFWWQIPGIFIEVEEMEDEEI